MQRLAARATLSARSPAPLRLRRAWLATGAAFVAIVVYLSLAPSAPDIGTVESVKLGHVLAYFWLTAWFGQALATRRGQLAAAAALALMGVALEYAQALTPHRTFAYADMASNALGALLGWLLVQTPAAGLLARLERRIR